MRYFYTDPLAAAWMAKHFEMLLRPDCYEERALPIGQDVTRFTHHAFNGRFFIHPESLQLLKPQDKDLYLNTAGAPQFWHSRVGLSWHPRYRIIQRAGKPFHWPESTPK